MAELSAVKAKFSFIAARRRLEFLFVFAPRPSVIITEGNTAEQAFLMAQAQQ